MNYGVGSRVFAVMSADDETVFSLGSGEYVGDKKPEGFPRENPCIHLDSGDIVWGMQCWWGPEERFEGWVKGRKVELVPVPDGNGRWKD